MARAGYRLMPGLPPTKEFTVNNQYAWLRMKLSVTTAVDTSASFADVFGVALPAAVKMVRIRVEASTTLRINPVGAAGASSGGMAQNQIEDCWGNKTELDRYRVYTGGANKISFFAYT